MKCDKSRISRISGRIALLLLLAAAGGGPALAAHRGSYSMEVLVDGRPISEHPHRGKLYIEAIRGREYSVRLRNHTAGRVAVALSVDGLNSIDARSTTAREASKWILGPHETITVQGWQTSSSSARRFFFTSEEGSYGAWLGDTRNLGIVSAAFFRERRPEPAPIWRQGEDSRLRPGREGAEAPGDRDDEKRSAAESAEPGAGALSAPADEFAATGIGRQVGHAVRAVRFDAESSPAEVISLRYEYTQALVDLGVLPRPCRREGGALHRRERARGFEGEQFAPDPFRPPCR